MRPSKSASVLSLLIIVSTIYLDGVAAFRQDAVIPSGELFIWTRNHAADPLYMLVTQAHYGPLSSSNTFRGRPTTIPSTAMTVVHAPEDNPLLCDNSTTAGTRGTASTIYKDSLLLVPRGVCSFEFKTLVAQTKYQAAAVAVYNTLGAQYSYNTSVVNPTLQDIYWPQEFNDYDCQKARAEIPVNELDFEHPYPYSSKHNDPLLSGNTGDNLCKLHDPHHFQNCESKRCLVAHDKMPSNNNTDTIPVCCAWDLPIEPSWDRDLHGPNKTVAPVTIPTIFVTMQQGDQLKELANDLQPTSAVLYSRWKPYYNPSSALIWMLGVLVAAAASYYSASEYHLGIRKWLWKRREMQQRQQNGAESSQHEGSAIQPQRNRSSMQEETLELEPIHALFFVVMASCSLMVLFFFKIYNIVKVMYAIGCSNAIIQVITYPIVSNILSLSACRGCCRERVIYRSEDFGDFSNWDVLAALLGYAWGITWLYYALFVPHSDSNLFFWVTQDIMGTCMCITFLGLIQLNNIQVATLLLIVAFVYDIFFVFVTPLLFHGKSVMITVATSGGPPENSALFCQKYPHDSGCRGGDPLPMLLTVPRLLDYEGGASMLGLGDIVLPGLLLSFAARLDAAKYLVAIANGIKGDEEQNGDGRNTERMTDGIIRPRRHQSKRSSYCLSAWMFHYCGCCCSENSRDGTSLSAGYTLLLGGGGYYFVPLVIAYAIGLMMANIAVYVMQMGQPALLYLVPCTLGTMTYLAFRRQELKSLWDGPRVIATADDIVFGRIHRSSNQTLGVEEGPDNATAVSGDREFVDDETGDVPLLLTNTTTNCTTADARSSMDENNKMKGIQEND